VETKELETVMSNAFTNKMPKSLRIPGTTLRLPVLKN
jgi:hypothetical protein